MALRPICNELSGMSPPTRTIFVPRVLHGNASHRGKPLPRRWTGNPEFLFGPSCSELRSHLRDRSSRVAHFRPFRAFEWIEGGELFALPVLSSPLPSGWPGLAQFERCERSR